MLKDLTYKIRGLPLSHLLILLMILSSVILRIVFMHVHNALVEEAYYWNYAEHLDYGYLDHPPMVALLIKLSTYCLGTHELAWRMAALLCWLGAAFFSFKLTELVQKGAGIYALLLLSTLPFYFFQSFIMTPDQPLLLCWSAALYCLYRALVLHESAYWYAAGVSIGLGLLSKYSIVLLGPATLFYLFTMPQARFLLKRIEPYTCALIALLCFFPVIYWNATHEWASFIFQGSRRITAAFHFTLHQALGLCLMFLTPVGVWGLVQLYRKNTLEQSVLSLSQRRFFQIFTAIPLAVFIFFSITHEIKFNWIGPGLLAIIPWLAFLMSNRYVVDCDRWFKAWFITASTLLFAYLAFFISVSLSWPEFVNHKLLKKFIAWDKLSAQFYELAHDKEIKSQQAPIFVALDLYNIASELSFYQAKFLAQGTIKKSYEVIGGDFLGLDSLMYRYWSSGIDLSGKTLILIATEKNYFSIPSIDNLCVRQSPVMSLWATSFASNTMIRPYYYQFVQVK